MLCPGFAHFVLVPDWEDDDWMEEDLKMMMQGRCFEGEVLSLSPFLLKLNQMETLGDGVLGGLKMSKPNGLCYVRHGIFKSYISTGLRYNTY